MSDAQYLFVAFWCGFLVCPAVAAYLEATCRERREHSRCGRARKVCIAPPATTKSISPAGRWALRIGSD